MKIAVAASNNTLEAAVDPRFGRCAWFVIVDSDTMECRAVQNPGVTAGGGAGLQASQIVAAEEVDAVVAGNIGPNAHQALSSAGIQVLPLTGRTVREAVDAVKSGQVKPASSPTVASHFGAGGGGRRRGRGFSAN